MCVCVCVYVYCIVGSEKMMTALGCAAPEYLLPKQVSTGIYI